MPIVLHLRPGTREWFFRWLGAQHPGLVGRYLDLYGHGAYAPKAYQDRISGQVRELAGKHGIGRPGTRRPGSGPGRRPVAVIPAPDPARRPEPAESRGPESFRYPAEVVQLTLL